MASGIDYGMGQTNVDRPNGIRYGVIPQNDVLQAWADSSEAEYGDPHCPKCGNEACKASDTLYCKQVTDALDNMGMPHDADVDFLDNGSAYVGLTQILPIGTNPERPADREEYETLHSACGDYACDHCKVLFDGEDAFGDEPIGYTYDADGYVCQQSGGDTDIFILKSPFYTHARFCSPCAPGACHLRSPDPDGEKAYCFGEDWFDAEYPCEYPIYRVSDDALVYSPKVSAE